MPTSPTAALVVSIDMGYGHMRAAYPLADALGTDLLHVDRPPLATPGEQVLWAQIRRTYERVSRLSQLPLVGRPMQSILDAATGIPELFPYRDMSATTSAATALDKFICRRGLGKGLVDVLRERDASLVTTHFAPALAADRHGWDRVYCVVTDSDINRIWAPVDPLASRIVYLAPSERVVRRLKAYGVAPERIRFTGFPLPTELLGGTSLPLLRRNLASRLVRLDPSGTFRAQFRNELHHFLGPVPETQDNQGPLVTFTVGGAGAQAELAREFLPGFRKPIEDGQVRLALVAGVRPEVDARFRQWVRDSGLESSLGKGLRIVACKDIPEYFKTFNALLAETDVLWTKPSEMTFFGALGIPLVLSRPVGVHERYNRRWAMERGAALKQRNPKHVADRFGEWLHDGTLAAAAWSGYMMLPKFGVYKILEEIGLPVADNVT